MFNLRQTVSPIVPRSGCWRGGWGSPPSPTGSCQAVTGPSLDHSGDKDALGWVSPTPPPPGPRPCGLGEGHGSREVTLLPHRAGDPSPFLSSPRWGPSSVYVPPAVPGPLGTSPHPDSFEALPSRTSRLLPRSLWQRGEPVAPNPISGERHGLLAQPLSFPRGTQPPESLVPRFPCSSTSLSPLGDAGAQLVSSN